MSYLFSQAVVQIHFNPRMAASNGHSSENAAFTSLRWRKRNARLRLMSLRLVASPRVWPWLYRSTIVFFHSRQGIFGTRTSHILTFREAVTCLQLFSNGKTLSLSRYDSLISFGKSKTSFRVLRWRTVVQKYRELSRRRTGSKFYVTHERKQCDVKTLKWLRPHLLGKWHW